MLTIEQVLENNDYKENRIGIVCLTQEQLQAVNEILIRHGYKWWSTIEQDLTVPQSAVLSLDTYNGIIITFGITKTRKVINYFDFSPRHFISPIIVKSYAAFLEEMQNCTQE